MQAIDIIFAVAVLLMSVVAHEVAHGYTAGLLGDPTARLAGRLTLNPLKHLDPIGSVIVPILTSLGGFFFGWAKPVPYNPYNLKYRKWGEPIVAAAGPLTNLCIALVFGLILRFGDKWGFLSPGFASIAATIVFVNLILAFFNLVPIPPLDGSKILFTVLPPRLTIRVSLFLERYGFFLILLFIFFLWRFVTPLIEIVFGLIVGRN